MFIRKLRLKFVDAGRRQRRRRRRRRRFRTTPPSDDASLISSEMAHSTTTAAPPHHSHLIRKYRLRNSPPSRLRHSQKQPATVSSPASRGVLLPLPPNLRRLPSRLTLFGSATMPSLDNTMIGSKRKRVFSTNENAHAQGRSVRKIKRRRGYKERDSDQSSMDVDESEDPAWLPTDGDEGDDSLLNSACSSAFWGRRIIFSFRF